MSIITFMPTGTTYLSQISPSSNFSSNNTVLVGQKNSSTDNYRGIIKFDISSIAIGGAITSAKLKLHLNRNDVPALSKTIKLYTILQNYNITTVTFNTQPQIDVSFVSTAIVTNELNAFIEFDVTNVVRGWYDGSIFNLGLMIIGNESTQSLIGFDSNKATNASLFPATTIELEIGGGGCPPQALTQYPLETVTTADAVNGSSSIPLGTQNATFSVKNVGMSNSAQVVVQLSPDGVTWINDLPGFVTIPVLAPGDSILFTTTGYMAYARVGFASWKIGLQTQLDIYATTMG